jgi:hypothetical protein
LNNGKDDELLVGLNGKLFQTARAEQLKALTDVREQVVSSRLTCIDDLK